MNIKHKLEYTILRSTIFFINLLPVPLILFLCTAIGYVAWVVFPFRIKVAYKNLSTVFPEMDHPAKIRLLRKVYLQFTRTFGLVFILHRKSLTKLVKNTKISGRDKLDKALERGQRGHSHHHPCQLVRGIFCLVQPDRPADQPYLQKTEQSPLR